jgi:hypothetical protein
MATRKLFTRKLAILFSPLIVITYVSLFTFTGIMQSGYNALTPTTYVTHNFVVACSNNVVRTCICTCTCVLADEQLKNKHG